METPDQRLTILCSTIDRLRYERSHGSTLKMIEVAGILGGGVDELDSKSPWAAHLSTLKPARDDRQVASRASPRMPILRHALKNVLSSNRKEPG